jgi:hypothetical protein
MPDPQESVRTKEEQTVLDAWQAWAPDEIQRRRGAADAARRRALNSRDDAVWRHAEILEDRFQQLLDMHRSGEAYFARLRGEMREPGGGAFPLDVRVHKFRRSEEFPHAGSQMLTMSHLAALADLVRNPAQTTVALNMSEIDLLRWPQVRGNAIQVAWCEVEDVELADGRVVRVAPRYGAIFEDRVRRRLRASAQPALDVLADVLDQSQNQVINDRRPDRRLLVLDGPAGTGKTVVAAHRIAVVVPPDSPGLYLTPTASLRDYVAPVLPRLGLDRRRARAVTVADLVQEVWAEARVASDLGPAVDPVPDPLAWERAYTASGGDRGPLSFARAGQMFQSVAARLGWTDAVPGTPASLGPLLLLAAHSGRRLTGPEPAWIIADEAQDIPPTVLRAVARLARSDAQWVLAGDLMQQMQWEHGWDVMAEAIGVPRRGRRQVWLDRNYRIPPVIHERAERLREALNPASPPSTSVPWHPEPGQVRVIDGAGDGRSAVREAVHKARADGMTSIAVIVADGASALIAGLEREGIAGQVLDGSQPYRGGLAFTVPEHVRGLEFDAVVIPDASRSAFPAGPAGAHRLYTCLSRARRRVDIIAGPDPSPWLPLLAGP